MMIYCLSVIRYGRGNKPVHLYTLHTPQDQKIETALDASIQPVSYRVQLL